MIRSLALVASLCVGVLASLCPARAGLTRHDVLVIANSNSPASMAVADYYKQKRGIPSSHVRTISCPTGDYLTMAEYVSIRDQIAAHLVSLGSDPDQPETDPIKGIVLCTKIPHMPTDAGERYSSLDSALAGMFNDATWGKEPLGVYGRFQPAPAALNSYYGDHRDAESFGSFRSAAEVQYAVFPDPGFTLVRMLDSNTALAAGGSGILFRGVRSNGVWNWSPVADRDRGFIAWRVSSISVLDSARAYACTGSVTRPHGGGTIIATSDGGLTWKRIRYSTRYGFKLKDALLDVDFADASNGWAVGSSQAYYQPRTPLMIRTNNAGASWQDLSVSLPASFTPRAVSAADSNNVWVCGVGGIYRSTDGGMTWLPAMAGAPDVTYNAIRVKSEGGSYKGWAVGKSGTVLRTEDGWNWVVQAAGLTTSDITDLSVDSSGIACASFGGAGFLMYAAGSGWTLRPVSVSAVVSAAVSDVGAGLAVGGTRYIFGESASGWEAVYAGQDSPWRPRYLVCRLDGYNDDLNPADGIPDDIKAIIDRGHRASSGGRFVLDEATNVGVGSLASARDALLPIVGSANVTYDNTAAFLTGQTNVIGYSSWGMHDSSADSYTTWGRPRNSWADGGVATVFESTDGRAFDRPHFVYNLNPGGTASPEKLSVTGFVSAPLYSGYRVALHSSAGEELASGQLVSGRAEIDLSGVSWPADRKTYVQIYFPPDDIHHPGRALRDARYPASGADTSVYDNRANGFTLVANPVRTLMAEYLREGASGGVCDVMEPWSSYIGQPRYLFPRYAQGFTWAESAYMSIPGIGWQEVVLGDPLMAPYATPPSVSITSPPADGQVVSGTVQAAADVSAYGASGVARVEFRLDDVLVASITSAPYEVGIDTVALGIPDGLHTIEALAFGADEVGSAGSAFRTIVVNNSGHAFLPRVSDVLSRPDGSLVGLLDRPVTGAFDGFFYIEEPDRARGLRVRSGVPVNEGDLVTVLGTLRTVDGEREILSPQ